MNYFIAVVTLTSVVLLGGAIVLFLQHLNREKLIKVLLAFSGGFLLSIAFVHFIPEIYENHSEKVGYFILLGFLVQLILEYFSGGIEHGHIHADHSSGMVPFTLFFALSVHSFFEGIPLANEVLFEGNDHGLLLGIALHKLPVAIALMTLLLTSGVKHLKAWGILILFSLMSPLGMIFGKYSGSSLFNLDLVLAVVVGMFLHISTTIIFESSENHKFNFVKLISILAGVGLAVFVI